MNRLIGFLPVVLLILGLSQAVAQPLRVSLNVASRPNPFISEWASRRQTVILRITNPTATPVDVKIDCRVFLNGSLAAQTKVDQLQPLTAGPGVSTYYAEQVIPINDVKIYGDNERRAAQTGMLPAGDYTLCVTLVDPKNTQRTLSEQVCKPFTITGYQMPVLLQPQNLSVLPPNTRPRFRWTPVSPAPPFTVRYVFRMMEVLPGQSSPVAAFRGNQPVLEREIDGTAQLPYPADAPLPEPGKTYVWSIRAVDAATGNAIGEQDGYADPFSFRVGDGIRGPDTGVADGPAGSADETGKKSGGEDTGKKSGGGDAGNNAGVDSTGGDADAKIGNNQNNQNNDGAGTPCGGNCTAPVVITDTVVAALTFVKNDSVKIGRFTMKITGVADGSASNLTGTGEIYIPWLLTGIVVEYQGLKLNAARQVLSGSAVAVTDSSAPQYPQQWAINAAASWSWLKKQVSAVDAWMKQKGNIVDQVNQQVKALKVPIGINNMGGYTLAITEFKFNRDSAFAAAVVDLPLPRHDDTLSFGVSSVPICPQGIGKRATLSVLNDITLRGLTPNQISFTLTVKARTPGRQGTYISWGCNNFDTLAIDLDVAFPRDWIVPRPDADTTKQSVATFTGIMVDWKEWMIVGKLPASTFVGTNGLGLKVDSMALDYSDLANPSSIIFPANYAGTQGNDFNGFYAKNITVYFPDGWRTFSNPNQGPVAMAKNLIICKTGLTGDFVAANVIQYPDADLNRLSGSVDTIKVSFVNSSLTQAYMRGKLTLPVTDTSYANVLLYKAIYNNVQKSFDFSITPKDSLTTKLFAGAKLKLKSTSSITMSIKKNERKFAMKLNGEVGWVDKDITIGPKKIHVDMSPEFENIQIDYNDSTGVMTCSPGTWSFASPQKKLARFPVTVKDVKFTMNPKQGAEVLNATLKFDVVVSLDSNRIGGTGGFEVSGAVEKSSNDAKFRFSPKFKDFKVTKIKVHADLAAVKIDGSVEFYNNDVKWGDGFAAALKATFKSMQMEVSAAARFGSRLDNSGARFRYWYVEAKAILPPPGIPFLTGYAFYGFGAAAWRRVNVDMTGAKPVATASPSQDTASGASMTPDKNINFGFKVLAVLGTTPDPAKMNADVALMGQFSSSGGMSKIGFQGDIWLMAKLTERTAAPVKGTLNITYDFTTKIFDLNAFVTINKPPVTGNGSLKVHLEGKTGIWYVKLGDPVNRNTVSVDMLGYAINSHSYFMFGRNITPPSGFMPSTVAGLAGVGLGAPSGSATTDAIAGNGFAAGFEVGFNTGQRDKSLFGRVNLRYQASGGFEINLSLLRYPDGTVCAGSGPLEGMNRWYVQGNVAAYANASCSIHIDPKDCSHPAGICTCVCCKYHHGDGCDIPIASLHLGAYLFAGFPKPSWLEGAVAGSFDVLGGAFSGSFNAEISVGSKCTPAAPAAVTTTAQDVGADQANKLISSIEPVNNATNVALTEPVRVIYSFTPNTAFDLQEQGAGASGDMINRTFQVKYSVTVEKQAGQTWMPVSVVSLQDALGAYLFRIKKTGIAQQGNAANANMMQDGQGGNHAQVNVIQAQQRANMGNDGNQNANDPDNFSFNNSAAAAFITTTNNWDSTAQYRITAVGTLWELNNGTWVVARRKSNNTDIKQTEVYVFRTTGQLIANRAQNNNMRGN